MAKIYNLKKNIRDLAYLYEKKISEVEKLCGVSSGYFSRVNESNVTLGTLDALTDIFEVDIHSLVFADWSKNVSAKQDLELKAKALAELKKLGVKPQDLI